MANPALKNGYISIANELVEKLASIAIPSSEMRCVWIVWRKTWGWKSGKRKKDYDYIALSQFEKMTGMKHSNVAKSLKNLVSSKILKRNDKGHYGFNQDHDEWVVCKRIQRQKVVVNSIQGSSLLHTKTGSQLHTNKRKERNYTKDTSKVETLREVESVIDSFKEVNQAYRKWFANKTQRQACERLIKSFGLELVLKVVSMIHKTNQMPYFPNITTPLQLEDKWSALETAWNRKKGELTAKKSTVAFS